MADDHGLMREAIVNRLASDTTLEVVGSVADGEALVKAYAELHAAGRTPDLVLCDYSMPGLTGLEATERILATDPDAKILILSAHDDMAVVSAVVGAGAVGYLLKSLPPDELRDKVRAALRGETVLDAGSTVLMARAVRSQRGPRDPAGVPLSPRELDVLVLVADGLSNAEIGHRLFISVQTVKTHVEHIFAKLGVSSRAAAVRKGIEVGAIPPAERRPADIPQPGDGKIGSPADLGRLRFIRHHG